MKQKGLGAGLGALFGDAAVDVEPIDFEYLPLQRIEPRQEQPRTVFEQEAIDELAESIKEHGVLSPLIVRATENGYYEIIAGERRWRAARAAGLDELPARIVDADDKKALELAMVENLQREDLNPIEEARGYKSLIDDFGLTQEDVAQRVSKSRPSVANALRLLSLPTEVLKLVLKGELPAGSARALLALKAEEAMLSAAESVVNNGLSVREVESLVKALNKVKPKPIKKSDLEVDYIQEAQSRLTEALSRKVIIKHGKGKGRIELEFYDQDDFDVLYETMLTLGKNVER